MSKQLLLLPKGSDIGLRDREKLAKAGFVVVEVQSPHLARLMSPEAAEASAGQLAYAAIEAIAESGLESVGMRFTRFLLKQIKEQRAHRDTSTHSTGI